MKKRVIISEKILLRLFYSQAGKRDAEVLFKAIAPLWIWIRCA